MKDNRWAYGPMFVGLACNVVLHFGAGAWIPTFFVRTYGWTAERAGVLQGIMVICTAPFALMIGSAALQIITPNQMRGQVTALFLFVFNVVGFGAGPTVVALLTDYVFRGDDMLRYSLCAAACVLGPLAALIVWSGLKGYAESVKRSASWV